MVIILLSSDLGVIRAPNGHDRGRQGGAKREKTALVELRAISEAASSYRPDLGSLRTHGGGTGCCSIHTGFATGLTPFDYNKQG